MNYVILLVASLLADRIFGEVNRWHPLVGFGMLANRMESRLRGNVPLSPQMLQARGALAVGALLIPSLVLGHLLCNLPVVGEGFSVYLLYLSLGQKSLSEHARAVACALMSDNLDEARLQVSRIVSRETTNLDEDSVRRATIESVLENGSDAVFGALFWFLIMGAPGAILYRLANTLDAMWGYRNDRYLYFGWAAAVFDDVMSWLPARLTAITYLLLGNQKLGWSCWRRQGTKWYSPNAGPVMAAGAGSLSISLGGSAIYDGKVKERPHLGEGPAPSTADIERAIALVDRGVLLWILVVVFVALILSP